MEERRNYDNLLDSFKDHIKDVLEAHDKNITAFVHRMDAYIKSHVDLHSKLNGRVGKLENWKSWAIGLGTGLGAIVTLLAVLKLVKVI